ncbi:MAG: hypothetical protein ABIP89_22890, partial [Polyangiaceae bacterium]
DFGDTVADVEKATDPPGNYHAVAVEWNPLGIFLGGRVSLQGEFVPAQHHAIELSPHFVHTSNDVAVSNNGTTSQTFTGAGAEVGYRYYTGRRGPNGLFVGPSFLLGFYNAALPGGDQSFSNIGVAVDVGIQKIFFEHLVVGGGLGLQWTTVSHDFNDLPTGSAIIAGGGVKPRFILAVGYTF